MRKFTIQLNIETDDDCEMKLFDKVIDYVLKMPECKVTETKVEEIK